MSDFDEVPEYTNAFLFRSGIVALMTENTNEGPQRLIAEI